jgi:hypothetical protein
MVVRFARVCVCVCVRVCICVCVFVYRQPQHSECSVVISVIHNFYVSVVVSV